MKAITVKFDDEADEALTRVMETNDFNQSDAIRECVLLVDEVTRMRDYLRLSPKKRSRVATEFDKRLVAAYQDTFQTTKRIFYPAVLAAIHAAKEKGVSEDEMMSAVRAAPLDDWVATRISRDDIPKLNQLLTENMLARLLPLADREAERVERERQLNLRGSVIPQACAELRQFADKEMQSIAYDLIQGAKTEAQVHEIIDAAMSKQLDKYIEGLPQDDE